MFIYFDRNGVLQEVINDKAARLGDLNANEIYVYVDEVELDDIWLTLKRPDGTLSVEKSFIANKVVRELPYDPKRDMKFFKDFKEYEFYKFTISDEITIEGVYQATIRMTYEDTLSALGVLVFKAETGVIKSDQSITQAQYDYLIWYVGSWQGQIGDLEEAMGIAQADILGLQNRMNVAEQNFSKIAFGDIAVGRAVMDSFGNSISDTYANKLDLVYSSSNNRIAITLRNVHGISIDADLIDLPKATTSADGLLAKEDKVKINNIASDIASMGALKQNLSEKNQINGYAGLDTNAKIPSSLLPDSVLGQLEYKGTFTPTAYPSSPEKGWFYISIGNGTIGGVDFQVGDWAVFNGSTWDKVDNTDAVMSVNGKLGVVILNGTEIQVGNGDTWTIEQRIVNIYAELNNRYTKAQTYSQNEIEQRLTDLLGMANLQDILIGSYTDGQTVLASDLSAYNFVIALGKDVDNTYTGTFKPSEIVSGNIVSLSPTVYLTRGATDFTITTPTSVKLWGIKLDGITTDDIQHNGNKLKNYLDYLDTNQIKYSHGIKGTPLLIQNVDFSSGIISPWINSYNATLAVVDGRLRVTKNAGTNISNFVQPKNIEVNTTDVYYFACNFESSSVLTNFRLIAEQTSGGITRYIDSPYLNLPANTASFISHIGNFNGTASANRFGFGFITQGAIGTTYFVNNLVAYSVNEMITQGVKDDNGISFSSLTNAQIKAQLDKWILEDRINGVSLLEKIEKIDEEDKKINEEIKRIDIKNKNNIKKNQTLFIAHNGIGGDIGSYYNTINGLYDAYRLGYRSTEIDLRLTSDGEVVLYQHADLATATNGSGSVESKTLAQIKEFDINMKTGGINGIKIPTLREFLDAFKLLKDMSFVIEFKTNNNTVIIKALEILDEYGITNEPMYMSFVRSQLEYLHSIRPELTKVWIALETLPFSDGDITTFANDFGANNALMIGYGDINKTIVDKIHNAGLLASMYGSNDYQVCMDAQAMGVEFLTADNLIQNNILFGETTINNIPDGSTDPDYTIPNDIVNKCAIEMTMLMKYSGTKPTITLGQLNYQVQHNENEWGIVRMQVIGKGSKFKITQTSGTFEFVRCKIKVIEI